MDQVTIRDMLPTDTDYILSSWLRNYQANSYFAMRIKKSTFFPAHEKIIKNILSKKECIIKIASPEDDNYSILGWCVAEAQPQVIHYIHVKPEFQRLGIATKLVKSLELSGEIEISHWTIPMNDIIKKHKFNYNPYRL